jgi:hypothetical protein
VDSFYIYLSANHQAAGTKKGEIRKIDSIYTSKTNNETMVWCMNGTSNSGLAGRVRQLETL